MADTENRPPREHPVQGGRLHRRDGDVAQRHGQQADTDPHPLGPREGGSGGGDPALPEAVLPQPELFEPRLVREPGEGPQPLGRELGTEHSAEFGHAALPTHGGRTGQLLYGVGSYRSSTTPLPKVCDSTSRREVSVSVCGNRGLPRPTRTGWT